MAIKGGAEVKRHNDWMLRLEAIIAKRQHTRFAYGAHDCCMWACDVVFEITGRDPAVGIRGTYADELGARLIVESSGGLSVLAAQRFGAEVSPLCAAAGDIGLVPTARGDALVVCVGGAWLGAAPFGLARIPLRGARQAWRCEV